MAKGTSFAEKAKRGLKKDKQFSIVKFVKSVVSEKTGQIRFQESLLKVPTGMSLDAYLKQLEEGPEPAVEEEAAAESKEVEAQESAEAAAEPATEAVPDEEVVTDEPEDESAEAEEPADNGASADAEEPKTQEPETVDAAEEVTDAEPEAEPEEAEKSKSD